MFGQVEVPPGQLQAEYLVEIKVVSENTSRCATVAQGKMLDEKTANRSRETIPLRFSHAISHNTLHPDSSNIRHPASCKILPPVSRDMLHPNGCNTLHPDCCNIFSLTVVTSSP